MPSIAAGLTSAGGIIGVKPVRGGLGHREVDQGQLEQGADAGEVVEPRRRTPSRRARCRSPGAPRRARGGRATEPSPRSRGMVPTRSSTTKSSSPPAGTPACDHVGDGREAQLAARPRRPRPASASAALTSSASSLAGAQQLGLLLAGGPRRPACRDAFCSARSASKRRARRRGAARRRRAARRRAPGPRRACAGRRGPGRGRHGAVAGRSPLPGYRCRSGALRCAHITVRHQDRPGKCSKRVKPCL